MVDNLFRSTGLVALVMLVAAFTLAHSYEDPVVAAKYRRLCSELTGLDDDEKFAFTQRQYVNGRFETRIQADARLELTGIKCIGIHWSCSWRAPVDIGEESLAGKNECVYGADWCASWTERGKLRCEQEPECHFDPGSPFEEDQAALCFYHKEPGSILTNGRAGRELDPWWDRNARSEEDWKCAEEEPHCEVLQTAQRSFATALQLEKMGSPEALGAYTQAVDGLVDTLGLGHPDTQRLLIHARRYLDGFTPGRETRTTELRVRDALSQRLLGLATHDRSQLRSQ